MALLRDGETLSFDDVSIIPNYSDLDSRDEVDLTSDVGFATLKIPLLSSPMDTVTNLHMLESISQCGAIGIHHRYCDLPILREATDLGFPIAVSPSMGLDFIKGITELYNRHPALCLDLAHGHSKKALEYAEACVKLGAVVISGNIVTPEAAAAYYNVGVDIFRVGVGNGSACSTRVVAGVGIPQFTAIQNIYDWIQAENKNAYILSDGGCHAAGDCVKALAAGSSGIISGFLFAGCDEAPGERRGNLKAYRGMASEASLSEAGKELRVEGISSFIPQTGSVAKVLKTLEDGMRAGFAYTGSRNIKELRERAQFVRVTHAGLIEGKPRI